MKRLIISCFAALAMLLPNGSHSQTPDTNNIQGMLQYVMQPLNKTQISTGYLEEYGLPAIPMRHYNGAISDTNIVELNLWRLLYFQLFSSYCQTGTNSMASVTTVNNIIKQNNKPDSATPIPVLIGQYNAVKPNAFSSNLLSYNATQRKVFDVPGRPQSPYENRVLFAAAPTWQYSQTGTETFVFKPNMVWGNSVLTVSQMQVNFQNGEGFKTMPANTPVSVVYSDTGYYKWTIRATLSNSSIVQCYAEYFVLYKQTAQQRYAAPNIAPAQPWHTIAPVAGVHSGGTISIVFSNKQRSNTLRKPLIVVENADAFNIAPSLQREPNQIQNFIRSLDEPGSAYDFNNELDDIAGYDLVFINFNDGVDAIERNAAVVTDAILRINANKQPDNRSGRREQNIVLGMGTGGLNARYALAQYTKTNATAQNANPTETRLLITHDSPHRGVNIALGLQHMSRMLGSFSYFGVTSRDIFPDFAETVAYLDAPVNQQTLIYRATSDVTNTTNSFINNVYQPMVNYAAPYRFVPTSLGNECANQLFAAGRKFMDFEQAIAVGLKMKVSIGLSLFSINLITVPLFELKYQCLVGASSIPPQTQLFREVARLNVGFKYILFGLIEIKDKGSYFKGASAPNTYLPIDGVPGSINTFLEFKELRNYQSGVGNWYFNYDQYLFYISLYEVVKLKFYAFAKAYQYNSGVFTTQYTALPVGSALDVDPFNSNTFTQKYVNGFNQNFPSKGNTFIAQESVTSQSLFNNRSMRFTARNARFMFNEMEQLPNTENCSVECQPTGLSITGTDVICEGSANYRLNSIPSNAVISWLPAPAGIVNPVLNPDRSVTLQKITNGYVSLSASFTSCGQIMVATKQIIVGSPTPKGIVFDSENPLCINERYPRGVKGASVVEPIAGAVYEWRVNNIVRGSNEPGINIIHSWCVTGANTVSVRSFFCETWSSPMQVNFEAQYCEPEGFRSYAVSPNPSTNTITVASKGSGTIEEIRIKDKFGNSRVTKKFANKSSSVLLDITFLPADIYIVEIFDGKKWHAEKIIKN